MRCQSPEMASTKVIPGQMHSEAVTYRARFEFMNVSTLNALRSRISVSDNLRRFASTKPLSNMTGSRMLVLSVPI